HGQHRLRPVDVVRDAPDAGGRRYSSLREPDGPRPAAGARRLCHRVADEDWRRLGRTAARGRGRAGWRRRLGYNRRFVPPSWACSAVGSAPEWHSGGHGFDSRQVHHFSHTADAPQNIVFAPAWCDRATTGNPSGVSYGLMSHEQTVLATLVVYQLALIALGLMTRERNRDGVDFFLGGRQLGPTVAAIAASASSSSAWTLLGVSGAAYSWGLSALWLFPACVGGFAINWMFIAPALRRASHETGAVTVTELIAGPVGRQGRQAIVVVASVIVLVSLGLYVAAQFQAAGKTFTETFGLSPVDSILIGAGVVLFYTMVGGFWAVAVTDALQGLMMATAA